ncbi:MAG: dienelactone hydrolase family protein [Cyclobacteriaceae bacterium]|nr:dienelactone hydrolase family protein [Cyclobacteriaceae bacterium]
MKLKKTAKITLVFFVALLVSFVGVSQPSIGEEGFSVIKEAYSYDKALPLNTTITETQAFATYTRAELYFTGVYERVGAYLAIPTTGDAPFPVVVLIDGMGGSKNRWFKEGNWPNGLETVEALIEKGFAVFTIDAARHGERFDTTGVFPKPLALRKNDLMYTVRDIIRHTVQDYMRGLDYLETREDIDTNKVGVYGLSMGGAVTFILTCLDDRIKSAVAGVAVVYGNKNSLVNAYNFTSRIKTKPVLMLMADSDEFYTPESATHLFNSIGGSHNQLIIFEGRHKILTSQILTIAEWFKNALK